MDYAEALRYITKSKSQGNLLDRHKQEVIEKAKEVKAEHDATRAESLKPFPESKEKSCTVLEREIIEKMGKYVKAAQVSEIARIDYYLGDIPEKEFLDKDSKASYLLDDAIEATKMLLKERFVMVL